jgi:hypothetical protein
VRELCVGRGSGAISSGPSMNEGVHACVWGRVCVLRPMVGSQTGSIDLVCGGLCLAEWSAQPIDRVGRVGRLGWRL